jgi:hypothetical protein
MIAGLHWTAWLLLLAAVGLGLAVELRFYFGHRRNGSGGPSRSTEDGGGESES